MKAVVTGGAKGLGKSLSLYLLSMGYEVYVLYNTSSESAISMKEMGINVRKCDITKEEDILACTKDLDDIDILINNAGIAIDNEYQDKSKEEFLKVIETNLVGTFLMTKHVVKHMKDGGTIINISSNNTLGNNSPLAMDYDASKAGINMLTKDFALALDNIKVIAYAPGWIDTDSIREMNPMYLKEEMAKVNQEFLLDPDALAKYIITHMDDISSGEIIEVKEL